MAEDPAVLLNFIRRLSGDQALFLRFSTAILNEENRGELTDVTTVTKGIRDTVIDKPPLKAFIIQDGAHTK